MANYGYTADGWIVTQAGAAFTCAQDTGNGGPLFSLKCVGGASNTDTTFKQRIESYVAAPLAGQTVTVQFRYKQSSGSTVTPKISSGYASATDNFATVTSDLAATSLTACATATWCTESYTFTVSASAMQGYQILFDCSTALTSAQACWITAADIRVTPGVATGINANPPPPELRPVVSEMSFSKRYYTLTSALLGAFMNSGTQFQFSFSFQVEMRATPTATLVNGTAAVTLPGVAAYNASAVSTNGAGLDTRGAGLLFSISGATATNTPGNVLSGAVSLSAEL